MASILTKPITEQHIKKAIIIGATTGIGEALAQLLIRNNYKVGITGIENEIIKNIEESSSSNLKIKKLDCISGNCSEILAEFIDDLGGLDLLIFSAGIGNLNKDLGFKVENRANKVNVLGFTEIADWCYRFFEKQGYGHFVSISSIAGLWGYWKAPAYHAAKAYQINYLEALRQKAIKSGKSICISDIRPGFVDTKMSKDKKRIWVISREKAANEIYETIKRRRSVCYCSTRWQVAAFIIKYTPSWVRIRM